MLNRQALKRQVLNRQVASSQLPLCRSFIQNLAEVDPGLAIRWQAENFPDKDVLSSQHLYRKGSEASGRAKTSDLAACMQ